MGFRSSFVTEHFGQIVPLWFVEKYKDRVFFGKSNGRDDDGQPHLLLASQLERKFYRAVADEELFMDIQKVLKEVNLDIVFPLVLVHECGGITRVEITQDSIRASEPTGWKEVEAVEHDYCYGCSDLPKKQSI